MPFASPGPVAIAIGPITLRWYSLILVGAAFVALSLAKREAARRGEDVDRFMITAAFTLAAAIVGARVYHIVLSWDYFSRFPLKAFANDFKMQQP